MSKLSEFTRAKALFEDEGKQFEPDSGDYILLDGTQEAYKRLLSALSRPLKIVLLYGRPGSGKTALLGRVSSKLQSEGRSALVYLAPTFMEEGELFRIYKSLTKSRARNVPSFFELRELFVQHFEKDSIVVLLDEAQLYTDKEMEMIRLLADTRVFKFVVALHKTDREELIAKDHFQSRIWETIELLPLSVHELKFFVEKKLLNQNLSTVLSMFEARHYRLIHGFTRGNIRETMKFMFKLFDFYEFLEQNKTSAINHKRIQTKHIEMVAIHSGYISHV